MTYHCDTYKHLVHVSHVHVIQSAWNDLNFFPGMQAVFREYEDWLGEEEMLEYVARGFNKAETKLEACIPYEEELVIYVPNRCILR